MQSGEIGRPLKPARARDKKTAWPSVLDRKKCGRIEDAATMSEMWRWVGPVCSMSSAQGLALKTLQQEQ